MWNVHQEKTEVVTAEVISEVVTAEVATVAEMTAEVVIVLISVHVKTTTNKSISIKYIQNALSFGRAFFFELETPNLLV